jgi:hypothetical protein
MLELSLYLYKPNSLSGIAAALLTLVIGFSFKATGSSSEYTIPF